jgi:hypothetical protein
MPDDCLFEVPADQNTPKRPAWPTADTHECPAGDCTRRVPDRMLMCPAHWRTVPAALQDAVWAEWADGHGKGTPGHQVAITDAITAANERNRSQ